MPKSRSKRVQRRPQPKPKPKTSPPWVPALFFTLLGAGVIIIIGNYVGLFPGETENSRLFMGLFLMGGAFIVATRWH